MTEIDYITDLLKRYLTDKHRYSTDEELISLLRKYPFLVNLLDELESEDMLKKAISEYRGQFEGISEGSENIMWNRIRSGAFDSVRRKRYRIRVWTIYTSAAAVLFFSIVTVFLSNKHHFVDEGVTEISSGYFLPGSNKATLQISENEVFELSSSHQGVVMGNQLSYNDGSTLTNVSLVNETELTLSTPRGGQYQVTLSDGTKVWLNAESKLVYPSRFTDSIRYVKLEGEAYFDVAEDVARPFLVQTMFEKIQVLGTQFNVNAYRDEPSSSVSLVTGSVKVTIPNDVSKIIQPGQQTVVRDEALSVHEINLEEQLAWKNGEFMFNNENIEKVLRQLARWYDLEIELEPSLREISIWGSVSRYENFNKVLDIIKMTDKQIQFKVKGRRVLLMK